MSTGSGITEGSSVPENMGINDLLPDILGSIFERLDFETRCETLPLVCKRWRNLTSVPSAMWSSVVIEPVISLTPLETRRAAVFGWLSKRATSVKELRLRLFDYKAHDFEPGDFLRIFKLVQANLQALHILKCGEMLAQEGFASLTVLSNLTTLAIRNWEHQLDNNQHDGFKWLTALNKLTSLTLEMDVSGFPNGIVELPNLEEVFLHKFSNLEVPESISQLLRLKSFAMVECGMKRLPTSVCQLGGLEVLNLGMNALGQQSHSLPLELSALTAVKQLGLCCNEYDAVPDVIAEMASLEVLWLSGNRMLMSSSDRFLPNSLHNLANLQELHLSCCRLSTLPRVVCNLSQLIELNLAGNRLSCLPEGITKLSKLRSLDLHRNNFLVVPPPLARLYSLRKLNMLQNNLVYDKNTVALAYLPDLEELNLPGCGDQWSWTKGTWSTRSFRYFTELICKLSSCTRVQGEPLQGRRSAPARLEMLKGAFKPSDE